MDSCDVVIVGARLAGSCAAAHLARAGLRVVVLDRAKFPSDQLSTHLLFPAGVDELRRMGALEGILASDPQRSPWVDLCMPDFIVRERWRAVGDLDYCMCVPRTVQDLELVRAARSAGADVRERCSVSEVTWRAGRACGVRYTDADGTPVELRAELVIGADGRRSTIAREVGAFEPYRASKNGRGLVFRYMDDPQVASQAGETIYQWRDGDSFAFAFPSQPRGRILALFMGAAAEASDARRDPEGYWHRKLAQHPAMRTRLDGATGLSKLRSTGETSAFFRASSGPGWALAGDAGHFKDPVIGQGQRDALWAARRLAERIAPVVRDHAAADIATRCWEAERDRECLPAYHFGNIETEIRTISPVLVEVLRRLSRDEVPDASDVFGRYRTLPQVVSLPRLALALTQTVRRGTLGGGAGFALALRDLRTHLGVREEVLTRRFRSTRPVTGSEHPHPSLPLPPGVPMAERAPVAAVREPVAA